MFGAAIAEKMQNQLHGFFLVQAARSINNN
jgi:hypothetical protein